MKGGVLEVTYSPCASVTSFRVAVLDDFLRVLLPSPERSTRAATGVGLCQLAEQYLKLLQGKNFSDAQGGIKALL